MSITPARANSQITLKQDLKKAGHLSQIIAAKIAIHWQYTGIANINTCFFKPI